MTQDTRPAPPYPANTRAKGWRFEYDMEAFEASDTWLRARNGMVRGALLMLHTRAWGQTPCGSLPNDDELISLLIDMEPEDFAKHKAVLLRDWYCAHDGRLYHPMLTERVLDMMGKRRSEADRKARSRAAKAASKGEDQGAGAEPAAPEPAQMSRGTTTGHPQESGRSPESVPRESDTRTRTRTSNTKEHAYACLSTTALPTDGGGPPPPGDGPPDPPEAAPLPRPGPGVPPCPYDALIDAYERCCPTMPQVRRMLFKAGKRAEAMRARWKWVMTGVQEVGEKAGQRMATTEEEGIAWFGKYFARVAESDFLTGRNGAWTGCDLEFLMSASKFAAVLEGKYHREAAHA